MPESEWCRLLLMGDWNADLSDPNDKAAEVLKLVAKQMGLRIVETGPTRGNNTLDFALVGSQIKVEGIRKETTTLSDHDILLLDLQIPKPLKTNNLELPNKKMADRITLKAWKNSKNTLQFMKSVDKQMNSRNYKILKTNKKKKIENELLNQILQLQDEDTDIKSIIQNYWKEEIRSNEINRYSAVPNEIKEAFRFLKNVFKFHEYDRKDGSIVNKIQTEDGNIIFEKNEVSRILIETLQSQQTLEHEPKYEDPIKFPSLEPLTNDECLNLIKELSFNKAITTDGISDIIFKPDLSSKTAKIFKNLWSCDWEAHISNPHHFNIRLVPLNKMHPQIPTKDKFRPICIMSPIPKLMEARVGLKLKLYAEERLYRGQTGFVPNCGIILNQMRAIDRVTERTCRRTKIFGLFLDFSNAFNTILHRKLYQKLEKILTVDEVQLIKAIYSRFRISMGQHNFKPNIGVAQGSTISPLLFNIYTEDLYEEVEKHSVSVEDNMGYADDTLVLCTSLYQLRKVISAIKQWSIENNLKLNEAKSGIVEFLPRTGRTTTALELGDKFEGIPIVDSYKYLGLWLNQKLTMQPQMDHILKKTNFITIKLWPVLKKISLEYRKNLWTILIRPLFEQLTILFYSERSITNKDKVLLLLRKTFRKFTLIGKNVENAILDDLMGFNLEDRADWNTIQAKKRWEKRLGKKLYPAENEEEVMKLKERIMKKTHRLLPHQLQEFLNLQTSKCPLCPLFCSKVHLEEHGIEIPSYDEIIRDVENKTLEAKKEKLSRNKTLDRLGKFIEIYNEKIKGHLNQKVESQTT